MDSLQVGQYASNLPDSIPVGTIVMYLGTTAPTGWLLCNGSTYTRTLYPALFSVVSVTYGSTTGANFAVPDLRDVVPVGPGATVGTDLGLKGGVDSVTLTAAQSGMPSHRHSTTDVYATTASAIEAGSALFSDYNGADAGRYTGYTSADATSSHENRMPYLIINYIIKAF
jgi:microcystin-dependent protein